MADLDDQNPPSTVLAPDYISFIGSIPDSSSKVKTEDAGEDEQSTALGSSAQTETDCGQESSRSSTTGESNEKPPGQALVDEPHLKLLEWKVVHSNSLEIRDRHFFTEPDEREWVLWEGYRRDLQALLSLDFFKLDKPFNIRQVLKDGTKDLHRGFVTELLERNQMPNPRAPLIDVLCGFSEGPIDVDFWERCRLRKVGENIDAGEYNHVEKYFDESSEACTHKGIVYYALLGLPGHLKRETDGA